MILGAAQFTDVLAGILPAIVGFGLAASTRVFITWYENRVERQARAQRRDEALADGSAERATVPRATAAASTDPNVEAVALLRSINETLSELIKLQPQAPPAGKERSSLWSHVVVPVVVGLIGAAAVLVPSLRSKPADCAAVMDAIVNAREKFSDADFGSEYTAAKDCGLSPSFVRTLEPPTTSALPTSVPTTR